MSLVVRDATLHREPLAFHLNVSVHEILTIGFRHRFKVAAALIVPPVLAAVLLLVMTPVYRAQTDILVKTGREYLATVDGDAGLTAPTSTKQEGINSEMALVTSRPVITETIRSIGVENLYPGLVENPPMFSTVEDAAVEKFSQDLSVDPVKLSNIFSMTFDAGSPQKAMMVLDRLVDVYIRKHTQVFAGARSTGYEESIQSTMAQIERLETRRTQTKLDNGIYDIGAQRSALITQRVEAQSHLQDLVNNQATLKARLAYLATIRPGIQPTMQTTTTEKSDEAVHAREALVDLRQTEVAMSARFSDGNPELMRVRAQIASLQRSLGDLSASRVNTIAAPSTLYQQVQQEMVMGNAELAPLDAEIARYRKLLDNLTDELQRLEKADLGLRLTTARIDTLTENLKTIQARFEQARTLEQTELAKQVSVVQVNKAIAPEKAAKPKKILFLAGGVLVGLLCAAGVVVMSVLFNKTLVTADAAERLVGLPVLVTIPMQRRRKAGAAQMPG